LGCHTKYIKYYSDKIRVVYTNIISVLLTGVHVHPFIAPPVILKGFPGVGFIIGGP
jgi:hypothetical protein